MASAKKCDRCGVFYEKNTEFKETIGFRKFTVDGMCLSTIADDYVSHKDLCDDCISKLYAFLDGSELKED